MTTPAGLRPRLGGIVSIAGGILAAWASLQLPLGNSRLLGPGAIPFVLSLALIGLGAALALRPPAEEPDEEPGGGRHGLAMVAAVILLVGAFGLVLTWLGFLLSATLLMYGLYAVGEGRLISLPALGWAVLSALAAYLLFVVALSVRLPGGTLWGL